MTETSTALESVLHEIKRESPQFFEIHLADIEDVFKAASQRAEQVASIEMPDNVRKKYLARMYIDAASDLDGFTGNISTSLGEVNRILADLGGHADEAEEKFISEVLNEATLFLNMQAQLIKKEIHEHHGFGTNFKDLYRVSKQKTKRAASWIKNRFSEPVLDIKSDPEDTVPKIKPEDQTFLEKILQYYLSEKMIKEKLEDIVSKAAANWISEWKTFLSRNSQSLVQRFSIPSNVVDSCSPNPNMILSEAMTAGGILLSGTILSTIVLAAGWHTLAWASAHLFLPALPIVILITLVSAKGFKKRTEDRYEKAAAEVVEELKKIVSLSISTDLRKSVHENKDSICAEVKNSLLKLLLLDATRDQAQSALDSIRNQTRAWRHEAAKKLGVRDTKDDTKGSLEILMEPEREAKSRLEKGDALAAAVFASLGFEKLMSDLRDQCDPKYDFSGEQFFRNFVDKLHDNGVVNKEAYKQITYLRRRRNEVIHHIDRLVLMGEAAQKKYVGEFLDQLDTARNILQV